MRLILASKSPYRKQQLEQLKIQFECIPSTVDEDMFKKQNFSADELCKVLSFEKANTVARLHPKSAVIGSDQLVEFEGEILGKPGNIEKAAEQLFKLSGKMHRLLTGLCLITPTNKFEYINETKLTMKSLSYEQCLNYVKVDNPIDCAGSYKIEKAGIGLFENIETEDFTSIQGLPMMKLVSLLNELGFELGSKGEGDAQ